MLCCRRYVGSLLVSGVCPFVGVSGPGHLLSRLRLNAAKELLEQGFQSLGAAPRGRRVVVGLSELSHFDECQLNQQALVARLLVLHVAAIHQLQCLVEEAHGASLSLLLVALALLVAHLEQRQRGLVFCHQHVARVQCQSAYEQSAIEAAAQDVVQPHHQVAHLVLQGQVEHTEVVVGIEHVEVFDYLLVGNVALREACHLVEH